MSSTTDTNIVFSQGTAVKEIQHVRKNHLEMNQQFVAQQGVTRRRREKEKIRKQGTDNRIEAESDGQRRPAQGKTDRKSSPKDQAASRNRMPDRDHLVDIHI